MRAAVCITTIVLVSWFCNNIISVNSNHSGSGSDCGCTSGSGSGSGGGGTGDGYKRRGLFSYPRTGCPPDCLYQARWIYYPLYDIVQLGVKALVPYGDWAAIGFSNDPSMINTDVVIGWLEGFSGPPNLTDRFITARSTDGVIEDSVQNYEPVYADYSYGIMTYEFERYRNTQDKDGDLSLEDCLYLIVAWGGTVIDGEPQYHGNQNATFTTERICIGLCQDNDKCRNNGVCWKGRCQCFPGFCGSTCKPCGSFCDVNPCQNGGACVLLNDGGYVCDCPEGYVGLHCEYC